MTEIVKKGSHEWLKIAKEILQKGDADAVDRVNGEIIRLGTEKLTGDSGEKKETSSSEPS